MADKILARLTDQGHDCVQWLVENGSTDLKQEEGNLEDLANSAQNKPVTLLLPASTVLLLAIDLPVKSTKQINQALPFALDDLLADDVENYHLAWYREPKGKVYVAAISHETLQNYLLRFQEHAIALVGAYPETLCLPFEDNCCSILIDKDKQNAILRTGQWLGGGIDAEDLYVYMTKLLAENPQLTALQIWSNDATPQDLSNLPTDIAQHQFESTLQLLQPSADQLREEFNLLTGPYSRNSADDWQWRKWLPALGIFLLAITIQTGVLSKNYWAQESELAALEAQTLALFKQSFPEVKRIVNIKVQAEQQLADLKKQGAGNGSRFMRLLYASGMAINANPSFQLRQLDFVNNLLQLQLNVPDISQLEQFKQQLETNDGMSVKILSAESTQNSVEAHLEISQK
jgi:general secretion pathway protein L